jgi:hypothetical protein
MIAIFLVSTMLLMPVAAHAGLADIITLITTITSTLENGIGTVLGGIHTLEATVNNFRQQVLFPVNLINQAKAFVGQVRAQFSTLAGQIHAIETSSATLVNPKQFESVLRSSQSGNLAQLQPAFNKLYNTVPLAKRCPARGTQFDRRGRRYGHGSAQDRGHFRSNHHADVECGRWAGAAGCGSRAGQRAHLDGPGPGRKSPEPGNVAAIACGAAASGGYTPRTFERPAQTERGSEQRFARSHAADPKQTVER